MRNMHSTALPRVLTFLAGVLIFKVTVGVVLNYHNYFPPNFEFDFLRGRELYFSGSYQWAFYTHIASGRISLVLGMILVSEQFRLRLPAWHRYLGRIQGMGVLLLVTPSGLWMAKYATSGPVANVSFAVLSVVTGMCVACGWRSAVNRRFADHRVWMSRSFALLCSAVVLRLAGGLATVSGIEAAWFDPLAAFELWRLGNRQFRRSLPRSALTSRGQ